LFPNDRAKDLEGKHEKVLDITTQREYLNLARSVFAYAVEDCEYIEKNPVITGLIPPKKKSPKGDKDPFGDPDDLAEIFSPENYLTWSQDIPSRFWIPLLALYTGCRLDTLETPVILVIKMGG
jgi:hypothetical protein